MGLSESTVNKMRAESEKLGGRVYEEGQDALEEDVTHFEEDSDPRKFAGAPVEEKEVGV